MTNKTLMDMIAVYIEGKDDDIIDDSYCTAKQAAACVLEDFVRFLKEKGINLR